LRDGKRLRELGRLKLAVYATEVEQLPDESLRLLLWQVPSGRAPIRYSREFVITAERDAHELEIEMTIPSWEATDGRVHRLAVDLASNDATSIKIADAIHQHLEDATALPGLPMSAYHYPDWVARREAVMRGRIPDSLLIR
jgi:hypothetical protein